MTDSFDAVVRYMQMKFHHVQEISKLEVFSFVSLVALRAILSVAESKLQELKSRLRFTGAHPFSS